MWALQVGIQEKATFLQAYQKRGMYSAAMVRIILRFEAMLSALCCGASQHQHLTNPAALLKSCLR